MAVALQEITDENREAVLALRVAPGLGYWTWTRALDAPPDPALSDSGSKMGAARRP